MKPAKRNLLLDMQATVLRKPTAAPVVEIEEAIAIGITYAMQFEFWKREISPESLVVKAVRQTIEKAGYSIVPTEAKRED